MSKRITKTTYRKCQRGLTLVELMVAMAISLIVLAGVITIFVNSKRAYALQEQYATMQENARFAFNFMARDLRGAGFVGCNPKAIKNHMDPTGTGYSDTLFDFSSAVNGWEAQGTGPGTTVDLASASTGWADPTGNALPTSLSGQVSAGSDVLVVKSTQSVPGVNPTGKTPPNAATIALNQSSGIPQGTVVMMSDCAGADVFQDVSNVSQSLARGSAGGFDPGNLTPSGSPLTHQYDTSAEIIRGTAQAYFIGTAADGQPALIRMDYSAGTPVKQELVEGVENMQVLYGEDLVADGNYLPNRYVPANKITDPKNVVAVRIGLLVRTPRDLAGRATDTNKYLLDAVDTADGVQVKPAPDQRMRKEYTFTIELRNKVMPQ